MTIPIEKIRETLDQLQRQLAEADNLDPTVASHLETTVEQVRQSLDPNEPDETDHHSITERLQEAAIHYEESHPTLSKTVAQLIDTLGQMGI